MKKIITLLLLALLLTSSFTLPAIATETTDGAQIFSVQCAGCHINGSNIIRRGKNLKKPALKRYRMDSKEAIASLVTNGKNNMPAYQDRLTKEQIQSVAAYVFEQANTGWR
ncbi:c-type cytochrome [Halotia branconii CENA392]|uniref:C-type cytochrome n=1 Tax=Halotia branconii CENA392 TaxID=1539056 RepID=A0AAJ6PCK0_9CYAN|nr:c-type cytochrome [Halotia branconii]WGV28947.1 c-type cytochrome [Halotia branconii CENA392]